MATSLYSEAYRTSLPCYLSPIVIALEVSSAAGESYGGVPGAIRNLVSALLAGDPETHYLLCSRFSRWRKGKVLQFAAPNVENRVLLDPLNAWCLRGARLLHSMGIYLPATPRIPKLLTVHDLNAVKNAQWVSARWHERRSARIERAIGRADHVVTYSTFTANEIQEHYGLPSTRVHPVPLGVDVGRFQTATAQQQSELRTQYGDYVLSIGLLTPRKNFPMLIRAVAPLRDMNLVLIGRPSDGADEVHATIDALGLGERVYLLQGVAPETLIGLMSAARVYVVPSLYEGFGLTVLEAMACGTPVVSSQAASLPEVAGDAACLVDAEDPDALSDAIRRVCEDSELARSLRARGLKRAAEMSWQRSAERLRALYRSVLGES